MKGQKEDVSLNIETWEILKEKFMYKSLFIALALFFSKGCFADYYSQCGQDEYINENLFRNARSGVFVDIGAHRGIEISNTYFFEKELDWTGICVEPIPELFSDLEKNRNCICIQGCVSDREGTASFIRFPSPHKDWFSGLEEKYKTEQLELLKNMYGFTEYELLEVDCFILNDILDQHGIQHINYLSIDTEGGELDIIRSIDYSKYLIDVISVEDNYNDDSFVNFLETKGFRLVEKLFHDLIFVNRAFEAK